MAIEQFSNILKAVGNSLPYASQGISNLLSNLGDVHFENPKILFLFFPAILLFVIPLRGQLNKRKILFLSTRIIILILLLLAAASPHTFKEEDAIEKKTTITVLFDSSESMTLFPNAATIAKNSFKEIKDNVGAYTTENDVRLVDFGGGNRTALGDALYQTILGSSKEKNIIILVSDGVSNHGKDISSIARLIAESNTTIYPLLPGPSLPDTAILNVYGAAKIPVESDYEMLVELSKTGLNESEYDLILYVDGRRESRRAVTQINDTDYVGFTLKFKERGIHRIDVEMSPSGRDFFYENNNFTKIIDVVEKPKILIVSTEPNSPLSQILKKLYNVTEAGSIPKDLSPYAAIYVDNVEANILDAKIDSIRGYVSDGNGLVVVGGNTSYDQGEYNNSFIENILPVRSREKVKEKRKPLTALFLIDISGSGQYTGVTETTINLEKALAIKLIRELDLNDSIGLIAFNVNAFPVSNIAPVSEGREKVIENILRFTASGDTDMVQALEMADDFLKDESNERVVVLLSDGIIRLTRVPSTIDALNTLTKKGVKVYVVGVGKDSVGISTLKYTVGAAGAIFFEPEEYQRLKLSFKKEGEEEKEKVGVVVVDPYHFVTRNLNLQGTKIGNYNNVKEKLNAQVLVSTEGGSPVLTVWRFGLGRVASLTTDNGGFWARGLYLGDSAKMVPGLTNWVVGDIEGKKKTVVEAENSLLGESNLIIARSENPPKVVINPLNGGVEEEFPIKRIGLNTYSGEYTPKDVGVHVVVASSEDDTDSTGFAVNYPKEYSKTGLDLETLEKLARLSQGKLYVSGDTIKLSQDVIFDVKNRSKVKTKEKKSLTIYFIAAALGVYFLDTAARRISDILRLSR